MPEITTDIINDIVKASTEGLIVTREKNKKFATNFNILSEKEISVVFTPFMGDEEKENMCKQIGKLTYDKKAHQIIFVSDSFLTKCSNKKDAQYVMEHWEKFKKSPPNKKQEALVISVIDFKNVNNERLIVIPYKIKNKKVIISKKMENDPVPVEGFIKDSVAQGFASSLIIDILQRKELVPEKFITDPPEKTTKFMEEVLEEVDKEYPNLLPKDFKMRKKHG